MARYLACLIYRLLTKGQAYVDRGVAHFESKRTERELLRIPAKANTDSGGNANGIPGRRRTVLGA
jgi:hypothetical protein